jgi:hypothetical protein
MPVNLRRSSKMTHLCSSKVTHPVPLGIVVLKGKLAPLIGYAAP